VLPPEVQEYFVPRRGTGEVTYAPTIFAAAQVQFVDAKLKVDEVRDVAVTAPFVDAPLPVDFAAAAESEFSLSDLEAEPESGASFAELPPPAAKAKNYDAWGKEFARWLFQTQSLDLLRDPETGATSRPGESEREFRIRLQVARREQRDAQKAELQQKYAPKLVTLQERLRKAEERKTREADQASGKKMEAVLSVGASLMGALFGRKTLSTANVNRMASAARTAARTMKESKDVTLAEEGVEAVQQRIAALNEEFQAEVDRLEAQPDAAVVPLETVSIKPKKTQIAVQKVLLAWAPRTAVS
jgi:hypothetical protein